jgi:hypothetical protein
VLGGLGIAATCDVVTLGRTAAAVSAAALPPAPLVGFIANANIPAATKRLAAMAHVRQSRSRSRALGDSLSSAEPEELRAGTRLSSVAVIRCVFPRPAGTDGGASRVAATSLLLAATGVGCGVAAGAAKRVAGSAAARDGSVTLAEGASRNAS